ncbi:MAG TPA: cytochrome-c oxidase, cbb3-type subunit III [Terriglobales bacterium]|nr:cytochrome-c oxidase, cbb3-type subunit III [Terriglobales bacterium]
MADVERDKISGTATTGHEWDGIKELDTPMPRWWVLVFYATIVFAIGYTIAYPAWPSLSGYTKGLLHYNSHAEYFKEAKIAAAAQKQYVDRIAASTTDEIQSDPQLLEFAMAGGKAVFAENCAQCHGAGGQGQRNYPVLADDNWLWGGKLADIEKTVRHGIRSPTDGDTRQSDMPRFGADSLLKPDQIADVADYVLSLSGAAHDAEAAKRGEAVFAQNCVACHGDKGQGNQEVGAPTLNDQIWQFGGTKADIVAQVTKPHQGVMPAWQGRLSEVQIKMVTTYVHNLGGGQ